MDSAELELEVESVWGRLPPGPHVVTAVVTLTASDHPNERLRPPLAICLSLDTSGSMAGQPLDQVVRSVERIVDLVSERDAMGVVAFSTRASSIVKPAPLDPAQKRAIRSRAARLNADDQTCIEGGLTLAGAELAAANELPADARKVVVLLSDGAPNVGAATPEALAEVAREVRRSGASVSTLGYGVQHNDAVLQAVAEGGGGSYRFIADPNLAELEIAQAVGAQADIALEKLELLLTPTDDVAIVGVHGGGPPRYTGEGVVVDVADLAARASRVVTIDLKVTLDPKKFMQRLVGVTARFSPAGASERRTKSAVATLEIGECEPQPRPAALAKALLVRADAARAAARAHADRGHWDGAAAVLRAMMAEIAAAPGYQKADGSALSEAWEQLLDEAVAMERRPDRERLTSLKASTAMRPLADSARASTRASMGAVQRRITVHVAGLVPEAYLLLPDGRRYRLTDTNTIGRTRSADVVVASDQVSRRHADVFAQDGAFYLRDLGSTNVTRVNDAPIGHAARRLADGDRIQIGDAKLVFEAPIPPAQR